MLRMTPDAILWNKSTQLELIQPVTGTNIYTEFLKRHGEHFQNRGFAPGTGSAARTFDFSRYLIIKRRPVLLLVVAAQHVEKLEFRGFRQKFIVPLEPGLLIRQFQMKIEILPCSPILVEIEYVWIIIANVEMIVDATGLDSRSINETAQQFKKFCTFFRPSVKSSCESTTWFHNFPANI